MDKSEKSIKEIMNIPGGRARLSKYGGAAADSAGNRVQLGKEIKPLGFAKGAGGRSTPEGSGGEKRAARENLAKAVVKALVLGTLAEPKAKDSVRSKKK